MDIMNEKLKKILNKDKKTSNLILIILLLVILLVAINYIFTDSIKTSKNNTDTSVEVLSKDISEEGLSVEKKLENILSKISGVTEANVMLTYSTTEKIIPVYDIKENVDVKEEDSNTNKKTTTEKTVAYEENGNGKVAIVESKQTAVVNGAIVTIKGTITESLKLQIKEAVCAVTNVPIHKIQIFEN